MGSWMHDFRFAVRMLAKNRGFAAVAILSTALAIGGNATLFSFLNAALLTPLPVARPSELVLVYTSDFSGPLHGTSSYPDYLDFRSRTTAFSGLVASSMQQFSVAGPEQAAQVYGEIVTSDYFSVLGVDASLGRMFDARTSDPQIVLGHAFWRRHFGADPSIVGRVLTIGGQQVAVAGVAPERFRGVFAPLGSDLWMPMEALRLTSDRSRFEQRGSRWLTVVGRLRAGATASQAQADLDLVAAGLHREHAREWTDVRDKRRRVTVLPESDARVPPRMRGDIVGFLGLVGAVVALVLLVACANVATLQLARGAARRREIAIRVSLGAGRGRLLRQLLTESVLLGCVGGALGLAVARALTAALVTAQPPLGLPLVLDPRIDLRVLGFTAALSLLTGVLFGLAPALEATRSDLVPALKDDAGASGYRRSRLRSAFIVAEVALAMVLLVGSGLFLRSLSRATRIDTGFDARGVALASFNLRLAGYSEARGRELQRRLLERVAALPGVESAALTSTVPLGLSRRRRPFQAEGYSARPGEDLEFHFAVVGRRYFETLRMQLVAGRGFSEQDAPGAPPVVVVNESFARRFWPGENPVGKRLGGGRRAPGAVPPEVIGVARDGKYNTLGEGPMPFVFLPALQSYQPAATLVVRTASDPQGLLPALRAEFRNLDATLPVTDLKTMEEHLGIALFPARAAAAILSAFGGVALLLAAIGIYGVMSYAVAQRTRELGIRVAVGAEPRHLVRLVVGQGLALAGIGLGLGLAAASLLTRLLGSMLYDVSPGDPITFIAVPAVLAAVALAASYIPARRALAVDPVVALRME